MRHRRNPSHPPSLPLLLLAAAVAVTTPGCTSIAGDVASHLAEKDVKAIDQELEVFDVDLGLFRKCLKERGGSCQGSDTTALPHSSQHAAGQAVAAVPAAPSPILADSVAKLPPGHPAHGALALLGHPVVGQAAALHNHLRGHETGAVPGVSIAGGAGAHGGPQSTVTMSLGIGKLEHFHKGLLSSLGTTAWESLHGHCAALLARHGDAPGRQQLAADCRRVAFIRGYLGAYVRTGEFLEVDVQLAGAIQAVNDEASKIESAVAGLVADLQAVEGYVDEDTTASLQKISSEAGSVGTEIEALVGKVETDLTRRFGKSAAAVFDDLSGLTHEVGAKAEALAQAADRKVAQEVDQLASELEGLLSKVIAELGKLEAQVSTIDQNVVRDVNAELDKADAALSNVFRVSKVGFVSRDDSFRARLPTLEITLDPTVRKLVTVTDADTGQVLTGASDFGALGVATDTSGVGTGSSIGAEVVRVFLEAVFDAHEGLPAVAAANLPDVKPTGLTLGDDSLPLFTSPLGNVDSRDLTRMSDVNDQVAARVRAILSRVVAGIGPFSLNNQPLEDFIVEIIATSVRQATAKATWCWYACNLDVDTKTLEADVKTAADDKVKAVEGKVKAKEQEIEEKAKAIADKERAKAREEAEHVQLRLKLGK